MNLDYIHTSTYFLIICLFVHFNTIIAFVCAKLKSPIQVVCHCIFPTPTTSSSHHPTMHPSTTRAPTHARCGLPLIPTPILSEPNTYALGLHDTAAVKYSNMLNTARHSNYSSKFGTEGTSTYQNPVIIIFGVMCSSALHAMFVFLMLSIFKYWTSLHYST